MGAAFSLLGLFSYYFIYFIASFSIFLLFININLRRVRQMSELISNKIILFSICILLLSLGSFFSLYFYLTFFFSVFLVRSASSLFFSKIKSTFMIFFRSFFVHLRIFGLIMFE